MKPDWKAVDDKNTVLDQDPSLVKLVQRNRYRPRVIYTTLDFKEI